ncbi:MAG TPA: aminotransferase class I/II-fold pyridoxal phosphate-dependent enzyme [Chloroflexia bacterium]|nr:aminotransferase class I/II-fold pyridoxal phosphate-dependent enzyme [Chloroflexia bacterium]
MLEEIVSHQTQGPATTAAHAGEIPERTGSRPVAQPIFQTTVHSFKSIEEMEQVVENPDQGWFYYRYDSPNHSAFADAMAKLENAEAAATAGSGMGAIFAALSAVLKSGDHIVADTKIYGGTYSLLNDQLPRFGIETTYVNIDDESAVRAALRPTTRVLYTETLTNPLLQVTDLEAAAKLAHSLGLLLFVDSTFSTPIVCRPVEWGADVVLHATTKYIGGHSDALGGIMAGRKDIIEAAHLAGKLMGLTQGPFDAWLNVRSLKTLPLRMTAHSRNAQGVAEWLSRQPGIVKVNYPGLESHPQHALARRLMPEGLFGGMLSFELESGEAGARRFVRALREIPLVPSLADVTTTISHPASSSHRMLTPEQRAEVGIGEGLLRLSVGIEDLQDIIQDLEQALAQSK